MFDYVVHVSSLFYFLSLHVCHWLTDMRLCIAIVRSPSGENSGAMSPNSMASHQPDPLDPNANVNDAEYPRTISPVSHDTYGYNPNDPPYNNNTLKLDNESLMMSQHLNDSKDDYIRDEHSSSVYNEQDQSASVNRTHNAQYKDNYETTFDLDGNVETKSICSAKSGGSGQDNRYGFLNIFFLYINVLFYYVVFVIFRC